MQKRWRARALAVAALGMAAGCSPAPPVALEPLAPSQATYVFSGRIVANRSSTLKELPAETGTYRVAVDQVHYQEGTFSNQTGHEVTVVSSDSTLQPGTHYLFYTEPFLFGSSLAVRAVRATLSPPQNLVSIGSLQRLSREQAQLGERVAEAELIVVGTVTGTAPTEQPQPVTEHDPELRTATVRVERVLAGTAGREVSFVFSASRDVHWYRAPKPVTGNTGIFLLNTDAPAAAALHVSPRFTLFHPLDLQPRGREAAIRSLMRLRNR